MYLVKNIFGVFDVYVYVNQASHKVKQIVSERF